MDAISHKIQEHYENEIKRQLSIKLSKSKVLQNNKKKNAVQGPLDQEDHNNEQEEENMEYKLPRWALSYFKKEIQSRFGGIN